MRRIKLNDSTMDVLMKMAEGNPGAISAMTELLKNAGGIDPQGFAGGMGCILSLDTEEIYGSSIYILWNDKCNRDIRQFVMLLRAVQLGFLEESILKNMAADQMRQVDLTPEKWEELDKKVCERLKDFKKKECEK